MGRCLRERWFLTNTLADADDALYLSSMSRLQAHQRMAGHLQTLQPQPPSTDPDPDRDSKGGGKAHPKQHQDNMSLHSLAPLTTTSGSTPTSAAGSTRACATKTTLGVWTRSRWDDMRRTWFVSSLSPTSPYTTPGLNITAISRRRGRCSFRRIAPLVLLGNRRRCSRRPRLRVQCISLPPSTSPGMHPNAKDMPSSRLDQITPRGRASCVALAARSSKRRASQRVPHMKDAQKYGLRALHKAHRDALNEEYIVYKQSLVDEVARSMTEIRPRATDHERSEPTARPPTCPKTQAQT